MCGIAGFIVRNGSTDHDQLVRRMTQRFHHRGPDEEGFFSATTGDGKYAMAFGHKRLSIIDLSSGQQPMMSSDGSIVIIFNGEIYNFKELKADLETRGYAFSTNSDTEVLLNAYLEYGEDMVGQLRGMFAFAIWDKNNETLFLVRDRFGKKPVFLYWTPNGLFFASEIKSFLEIPGFEREVDLEAVWNYMTYRYVPSPRTLFVGLRKLLPGHFLVWRNGHETTREYYTLPDKKRRGHGAPRGRDAIIKNFLDELGEAVELRMLSDVPYGMFLSGGIDSSTVLALMTNYSEYPVKTFSVGFSEQAYSELLYARQVAKAFGSDHHELIVTEKDMLDRLPDLVAYRDAPVSEPSDIPIYLLSMEAGKSVKMVLTGEGSDEALGGYPKHAFDRFSSWYQFIPRVVRSGLIEPLIHALPYRFRRMKIAVANLGTSSIRERFPGWFGALDAKGKRRLLAERIHRNEAFDDICGFDAEETNSGLRKLLYFDQANWLPDNLLERGDRMTMAASLEARMPFMDHKLIEYVSSLPDNWRVRGMTGKYLLRQAVQTIIPEQIIKRPKVGFRVPVNKWFQGPLKDYLYENLFSSSSLTKDYYNQDELIKIYDEHINNKNNNEKILWTLLNLEIWHRIYVNDSHV